MKCPDCNHTKWGDFPKLYDIYDNLMKCRVCDGVFDQNGEKVNPKEQSEVQDPDFESSDNPGKHFAKFNPNIHVSEKDWEELREDVNIVGNEILKYWRVTT